MNYKRLLILFAILSAYLIPLVITLYSIFSGSIAFWYDPARDLLAGLTNIEKISLIGPTSGIPGLFYGPYWIWMLSIGLLISHDPRIVALFVAAVPYFLILPFIFFSLSRVVGKRAAIIGWILFMFAFGGYSAQLWNPHPAPLLVFALITLLVFLPRTYKSLKDYLYLIFTGFVAGLLIQFHISFGIAIVSGVFLYLFLSFLYELYVEKKKKEVITKNLITVILVTTGISISALPFFVFEVRHGFGQLTTIITTLTTPHAVVGVIGLSNAEILYYFSERFARLLSLPLFYASVVGIAILAVYAYQILQKKITYSVKEVRLLVLTVITISKVVLVYLTSRNPVWDYHFIGVEVLFVLLLMSIIAKSRVLMYAGGVLVLIVTVVTLSKFSDTLSTDPLSLSSLATKEHVVNRIFDDAGEDEFALIAYNPAIYTFDYDYLTQWTAEKNNKELPVNESSGVDLVYLIIPPDTTDAITQDFINYKTPNESFMTVDTWDIPDGTEVIKRQIISKQ